MPKMICKKCILDSDIPGITIDEETGLCHFCETYTPLSSRKKDEYLTKIEALFEALDEQEDVNEVYSNLED